MEHAHTQYAFTHSLREQRLLGRAETPEPSPKPKTELDHSTYGDFLKQKGSKENKEKYSSEERDLFREYATRGKPLVEELKKDVDKLSDAQKEKYNELKMKYTTRVIDPLHQFDVSVRENEDQYMEIRDAAEDVIAGLQKLVDEKNAPKAPGFMPRMGTIVNAVKDIPAKAATVLKGAALTGAALAGTVILESSAATSPEKKKEVPQTDLEKVRGLTADYRRDLVATRDSLEQQLSDNLKKFNPMKYAQDHGTAFSKAQTAELRTLGNAIAKNRTALSITRNDLARLDARERRIAAIPDLEKRVQALSKTVLLLKQEPTTDSGLKLAQIRDITGTIEQLKAVKSFTVNLASQIRRLEQLIDFVKGKRTTQQQQAMVEELQADIKTLRSELTAAQRERDEVLSIPTLQKSTQTFAVNQAEMQRIIQARPKTRQVL